MPIHNRAPAEFTPHLEGKALLVRTTPLRDTLLLKERAEPFC